MEQRQRRIHKQQTEPEEERIEQRKGSQIRVQKRRRHRLLFFLALLLLLVLLYVLAWPLISGKPHLKLVGHHRVTVSVGEDYVDEGATATHYGRDVSAKLTESDEVDTEAPGTYRVTYSYPGRFRTYSVKRKVKVADGTAPEIVLNGDAMTLVDDFSEYQEPGATALDNCDGDVTGSIAITGPKAVNAYMEEVTYSVKDAAGNKNEVVRQIQIRDDVLPEIALQGEASYTIDRYTPFEDPGVTASDNRDGDITDQVEKKGYVDVYRTGTYEVTYTATDTSGNAASVTRTVKVKDAPSGEDHTVYLTFDDGPSQDVTVEILDILKENGIQATFFICDYEEDEMPILQRMIDEGHTIGIHGSSHSYKKIYASADAFMENIDTLADKLEADTGYEAFCMRFPGGSSNAVSEKYCKGIMSDLVLEVTDAGWMYFDWNIDSGDANGNNVAKKKLISNVEKGLTDTENVVLMHDTSTKQTTADALQKIIDDAKNKGYTFAAITKETPQVHHKVNN